MGYADYFQKTVARGLTGSPRVPYSVASNRRAAEVVPMTILDEIDQQWASGQRYTSAPHQYFDYFFSGQDIKVYVAGTEDNPEFSDLPIVEMAWKIEQQKHALHGFWSYTRDQMMRGTRTVQGALTLATKSPDFMTRLLTAAAVARSEGNAGYTQRPLTEDDRNIDQYWGKNIDPGVGPSGKNIFSVHPPCNLVVIYGLQSVSISDVADAKHSEIWQKYQSDYPLAMDYNERLVESDPLGQTNRVILEDVEFNSYQTGYAPDGSVISEQWTFEARDLIIPNRNEGAYGRPTRNTRDLQ